MPDREVLISDLNDISEILIKNGYTMWSNRIQDALALLKEQEEIINDLTDTVLQLNQHIRDLSEYMTPYGKVKEVRAAVELLEKQETSNTRKARIFQCEKCGYGFDDIYLTDEHNYDIEPHYCPNCGRLVKRDAVD